MQKVSNILQINDKINLEVNVVDMSKNQLKNQIHHTKIRSIHVSNPFKHDYVIANRLIITLWLVHAETE